jgi:hypothetical protein
MTEMLELGASPKNYSRTGGLVYYKSKGVRIEQNDPFFAEIESDFGWEIVTLGEPARRRR